MVSDEITVRFRYERALWRRAMTGWWRSVVPPEPFLKRAIFWAFVWFLIGILWMGLIAMGQSPYLMIAGLFGAAVLIFIFGLLQRTRMSRFWDIVGSHWDRAGETQAHMSANGLTLMDDVAKRELSWAAIDAIKTVRGGTVFRSGIAMMVIPDAALPDGMSPTSFRARVQEWRRS